MGIPLALIISKSNFNTGRQHGVPDQDNDIERMSYRFLLSAGDLNYPNIITFNTVSKSLNICSAFLSFLYGLYAKKDIFDPEVRKETVLCRITSLSRVQESTT